MLLLAILCLALLHCSLTAELEDALNFGQDCNYPNIDVFSNRVVDILSSAVPATYLIPDDETSAVASRQATARHLNSFYRSGPTIFQCSDTGITIKVPLKFATSVTCDYEVTCNLNYLYHTWQPVQTTVAEMEAQAVFDVLYADAPAVQLTSLDATKVKNVRLQVTGTDWFADYIRNLRSTIVEEFATRVRNFVRMDMARMLRREMLNVEFL